MKKSILIFFMLVSLVFSAFSANNASIVLSGSVSQNLTVDFILGTGTTDFVLNENGATVALGTINVKSNLKSWVLKVYSINGGKLKNTDNDEINYTFTMGSLFSGITLLSTIPVVTETGYASFTSKTAKTGTNYPISITYSSDGGTFWSNDRGNYTDTIIVTASVN